MLVYHHIEEEAAVEEDRQKVGHGEVEQVAVHDGAHQRLCGDDPDDQQIAGRCQRHQRVEEQRPDQCHQPTVSRSGKLGRSRGRGTTSGKIKHWKAIKSAATASAANTAATASTTKLLFAKL